MDSRCLEAEQAVLGAFLIDHDLAAEFVDLESVEFATASHATIASAIRGCVADGVTPDLVTVSSRLGRMGEFDEAGGADYLLTLTRAVPTVRMAGEYAAELREWARARRLRSLAPLLETAAPETLREVEGSLAALLRRDLEAPPAEDLFLSVRELPREHVPPLLGDGQAGLLPERELVFLHGAPRSFKTWFSLALGIAVASGEPLLGRFRVSSPGPVLFVQEEGTQPQWRERVEAFVAGAGLPEDVTERVRVAVRRGVRLGSETAVRELARQARKWEPRLIVLDPLSRLHGADENSAQEMSRVVSALVTLVRECDAAVLVVHHDRKSGGGSRASEGMRGSSVLWGAAGTIAVRRDGPDACVVEAELKDAEPVEPFRVAWRFDEGRVVAEEEEGPASARDPDAVEARILEALTDGPRTVSEIVEATGLGDTTTRRALQRLGSSGVSATHRTYPIRYSLRAQDKTSAPVEGSLFGDAA